jgi:hypothetical protein
MLATMSIERSWQFVAAGVFALGISALVAFSLWQRGAW